MLGLDVILCFAIWHWPLGGFMQEHQRATDGLRDWPIAVTVLTDLIARSDSPIESLPGEPAILFSEQAPFRK